jgi:hypothetical protein
LCFDDSDNILCPKCVLSVTKKVSHGKTFRSKISLRIRRKNVILNLKERIITYILFNI